MSDIRPEDLHLSYRELQHKDQEELFRDSKGWPNRACPLCSSDLHVPFVDSQNFRYVRCQECCLIFLNPCPPTKALENYYHNSLSASYFHEKILFSSETARRQIFKDRALFLKQWSSSDKAIGKKLLDLGCSIGTFLQTAQNKDWEVTGIELNQAAKKIASERSLAVFSDITDLKKSDRFDAITAWEVLAHVEKPVSMIASLSTLLNPEGLLFLTTPNVEAIEYRLLKENHSNMTFPFLQLFSQQTIKHLLQANGFEIIHSETPGTMDLENISQFYAHQKHESWPQALSDFLFGKSERDQNFRNEIQKAIVSSGQSGHLRIVGKLKEK